MKSGATPSPESNWPAKSFAETAGGHADVDPRERQRVAEASPTIASQWPASCKRSIPARSATS